MTEMWELADHHDRRAERQSRLFINQNASTIGQAIQSLKAARDAIRRSWGADSDYGRRVQDLIDEMEMDLDDGFEVEP